VARYWDHESSRHGHYFAEQYGAAIVALFADLFPRGATTVDYGCGAGGLLRHLLARAGRVFGVEPSPRSRAEVERRFGGQARFAGVVAPEEAQELEGQADVVFCVEVIEHLYDDALARLLAAVRRLLRPGGIAVFTTPAREALEASELYCPRCEHVFHRWQHVRSWEPETLRAALSQAGFEVLRCVETDLRAHPKVSRARFVRRLLRRLRGRRARSPHLVCAARRR
jgi:SAM-dependent methyltransferase